MLINIPKSLYNYPIDSLTDKSLISESLMPKDISF